MKPIENPDLNITDELYWERVLKSHKLGLRRGESKKLSYGQDYSYNNPSFLGDGARRKLPAKTLSQIENID